MVTLEAKLFLALLFKIAAVIAEPLCRNIANTNRLGFRKLIYSRALITPRCYYFNVITLGYYTRVCSRATHAGK